MKAKKKQTAAHTPGPYFRAKDAQGTCGLMVKRRGKAVAVAWFSSVHAPTHGYVGEQNPQIGRPEREANANLFDAAPAMLAVIRRTIRLNRMNATELRGDDEASAVLSELQAVAAKAGGG